MESKTIIALSDSEKEYIRQNYKTMCYSEIAEYISWIMEIPKELAIKKIKDFCSKEKIRKRKVFYHKKRKLSKEQIFDILKDKNANIHSENVLLALKYNVTPQLISLIKKGKTYKDFYNEFYNVK
jgi:hypothetical protein